MDLIKIKNKNYIIPKNVSKSSIRKYKYVINSDYAKYIYAIASCGGVCMLRQFIELLKVMDAESNLTFNGYTRRARIIIDELESFGFVEVGYLNRNKYILLKHSSVALATGDYKTHKRVSEKNIFKSDKFINSITKMQGLLDYDFIYEYQEIWEQLIEITKKLYKAIIDNGNIKGYDISLIEKIIELSDYKKITVALENKSEHKHKLGAVRLVWTELANLFIKISQKGCLISSEPLYFKIFHHSDGLVSLHYVPVVVIYDSMKSLEYYDIQKTFLTNGFYHIRDNNTLGLRDEYEKNKTLGYEHFNRIGYTVKIIGSNEDVIIKKKEIMDEPYNNGGIYISMIKKSEYCIVDIEKYINHSNIASGDNENFDDKTRNMEKTIESLVNDIDKK